MRHLKRAALWKISAPLRIFQFPRPCGVVTVATLAERVQKIIPRPAPYRFNDDDRVQGCMALRRLDEAMTLVEEFEHALPRLQVGRAGRKFQSLARSRERDFQHFSDLR